MKRDYANLVLRAGLAFAFLYPPINAIGNPDSWLGYFPHFLRAIATSAGISDMLLLHGFGLIEVVIALWLLSGWRIFWPSLVATLMLAAIILFDLNDFEILFRDLSIASIALALCIQNYPFKREVVA